MVDNKESDLNDVFLALADPTRRSIVERLREGRATMGELAEPFDMSFWSVSKHIQKLEAAGIVRRQKEGRTYVCELMVAPMRSATTWIEQQRRAWEQRLDRLEGLLDEQSRTST